MPVVCTAGQKTACLGNRYPRGPVYPSSIRSSMAFPSSMTLVVGAIGVHRRLLTQPTPSRFRSRPSDYVKDAGVGLINLHRVDTEHYTVYNMPCTVYNVLCKIPSTAFWDELWFLVVSGSQTFLLMGKRVIHNIWS